MFLRFLIISAVTITAGAAPAGVITNHEHMWWWTTPTAASSQTFIGGGAGGSPLPLSQHHFTTDGSPVYGLTPGLTVFSQASTAAESTPQLALVSANDIMLSVEHSTLQNSSSVWSYSLTSDIDYTLDGGPAATAHGPMSYTGSVAPGDTLSVRVRALWQPGASASFDLLRMTTIGELQGAYSNETGSPMAISGLLGTGDPLFYDPGLTFDRIAMRVDIRIDKAVFSTVHQSTGTTWVSVDPSIGTSGESINPFAVPEPSSMALLFAGFAATGCCRLQRRRAQKAHRQPATR